MKTHVDLRARLAGTVGELSHWRTCLVVAIVVVLAAGCGSRGKWGNAPGVDLAVAAGDPPIESIVWSPTRDDQVLATLTDLNHHDSRVYLQDLTTGNRRELLKTDGGSLRGLALSPTGKQVLILKTTGVVGKPNQLLLVDVETLEMELLAERAGSAAWSHDGAALAYFSYGGTLGTSSRALSLRIRDTATAAEQTLYSSASSSEMGLSWSSDNSRIVFSLGGPTASDLYVIDAQSGRAVRITTSGSHNSPAWSPRDDIIAYQSYTEDGVGSHIRLIQPNGDCEFTLPQLNYVWSPTWLPDAAELAVVALDGVYIANLKALVGGEIGATLCKEHP